MLEAQYVDELKFKDAVKKSGLKIKFLAKSLGLTYEGFRKKSKGTTPFRKLEVDTIVTLLGLTDAEQAEIFFPEKSTKC